MDEQANCLERFPGGDFAASVDLTNYTLPDGTSGTYALVKPDKYAALLAADVPETVLALMIATQRPIDVAALEWSFSSTTAHGVLSPIDINPAIVAQSLTGRTQLCSSYVP